MAVETSGLSIAQPSLWDDVRDGEDPNYLSKQLVTYIGSKRALLGHIGQAVARVKERVGKDRLRILDAFAGSGVWRAAKARVDGRVEWEGSDGSENNGS